MSNIIGIDLGGTKIAATRFTADSFHEEESLRIDTDAAKGLSHVITEVQSVIEKLQTEDTVAIGIGVPGLVQQPDGITLKMPNIPDGINIDFHKELDASLPLSIDNDANCFTLAEALHGAGKGHSVVAAITMGTGVGGGIVIDGKVFRGAHGYSAEFGHMLLKPGSVPYASDDIRGDVEQYLSGTAMGKRCAAAESPADYLEGEVCEFMRPDVFTEVAWLCTNLIHVLDPSVIVFGGSAGRALTPHLASIEVELQKWLLPNTPVPELKIAELKNSATLGAAMLCS